MYEGNASRGIIANRYTDTLAQNATLHMHRSYRCGVCILFKCFSTSASISGSGSITLFNYSDRYSE